MQRFCLARKRGALSPGQYLAVPPAAMSSSGSSGEDFGFPNIGDGFEEDDEAADNLCKNLEAEFDSAVEASRELAAASSGYPDVFEDDTSTTLPVAEPTAGNITEPTVASQAPRNVSGPSSPSIVVTPISKDMRRRRINIKRAHWEIMSPDSSKKLNPMVFLNNPCFKKYTNLPRDQRLKVLNRMRVKRHRTTDILKKGECVTYQGKSYMWPKEAEQEDSFMETMLPAFFLDVAACPTASPEERGCAMDRLLAMQASGALSTKGKQLEEYVLKQKSILMTYQGAWGVLLDLGAEPSASLGDLTLLVKQYEPAMKLFDRFLEHFQGLHDTHKIKQFVVAQEICSGTWSSQSIVRVHFHAWIQKRSNSALQLDDLSWEDSSPYVNQSALEFFGGKGSRSAMASFSGAFYLQVDKLGTVRQHGTLSPFTGYHVKDYWITTMLSSQKITFDTARLLYVQGVVRAESNLRQLEYVQKMFWDIQADREKEACEAEILKSEVEFKSIPEVETWKLQFACVKSRYKFLVLDGPSQTGKTRFAYSLSPPPTLEMSSHANLQSSSRAAQRKFVYYADCSGGLPDLRNFRRRQHKLMVLDELHPKNAVLLKKYCRPATTMLSWARLPRCSMRIESIRTAP